MAPTLRSPTAGKRRPFHGLADVPATAPGQGNWDEWRTWFNNLLEGLTTLDTGRITGGPFVPNAPLYASDVQTVASLPAAMTNAQLMFGVTDGPPIASQLVAGANIALTWDPDVGITISSTNPGGNVTGSGTPFQVAWWAADGSLTSSAAFRVESTGAPTFYITGATPHVAYRDAAAANIGLVGVSTSSGGLVAGMAAGTAVVRAEAGSVALTCDAGATQNFVVSPGGGASITADAAGINPYLSFRSAALATYGKLSAVGTAGEVVAGSVVGDLALRCGTHILLSADNGVRANVTVDGASNQVVTLDGGGSRTFIALKLAGTAKGYLGWTDSGSAGFTVINAGGTVNNLTISDAGKWGGRAITTPTAWLHLPAGTTAATTAPIKFTCGSALMTTSEPGAFEFESPYLYITQCTASEAGTYRRWRLLNTDDILSMVTGGGSAGAVAVWSSATAIGYDANFTWASDILTVKSVTNQLPLRLDGTTRCLVQHSVGGVVKAIWGYSGSGAGGLTAIDAAGSANNMMITDAGKWGGRGITSPSAWLELPACTTAANTASLKITAGTLMTTPEAGAIESDGTDLWWTDGGGTRRKLNP
jgi:hypothetical protein